MKSLFKFFILFVSLQVHAEPSLSGSEYSVTFLLSDYTRRHTTGGPKNYDVTTAKDEDLSALLENRRDFLIAVTSVKNELKEDSGFKLSLAKMANAFRQSSSIVITEIIVTLNLRPFEYLPVSREFAEMNLYQRSNFIIQNSVELHVKGHCNPQYYFVETSFEHTQALSCSLVLLG